MESRPSQVTGCRCFRNGDSSMGRRNDPRSHVCSRLGNPTTAKRSMNSTNDLLALWGDARILALRPPKNAVDPARPYAFLVEPERTRDGVVEDTAVLFLTNRECPFRCLMCDLWKNTTDDRVTDGAIAEQIEFALKRLPRARHIKLYNAGNFFDAQAIPPADWPRITELLHGFRT